ncbi:MAG: ATP-grasp domain-containing protein [Bacillota bacterium]|nr:ATP-grasp domain-containing protein [Bacillota bacterium]
MKTIKPLLFGGDINVYSVARAFHEAYGLTSDVYSKYDTWPVCDSRFIRLHPNVNNDKQDTFLKAVCNFAKANSDATVLLIGCGDSYVQLAAENLENFPENVVAPYISADLMKTLTHKEKFYELCDKYGIDHPNTFVYKKDMGLDFDLPFDAPFICKPANGVMYWEHPFEGQDKVFKAKTRERLNEILTKVYEAGYTDSMIIQDFIPGDDSYMRVLTNYSDRNCRVKMMALGHTILEEHTPHGIGNHAVIINEYEPELCEKLKSLLEELKFTGFSNFDIKYDQRDNKFKVFEINVRQGRSNYYVTGGGCNIAKLLVEDRIEKLDLPFVISQEERLWRVIPKAVALKYANKEYKDKIKKLEQSNKVSNSLWYKPDMSFKRTLKFLKGQLGHFYKYHKYMEK